MPVESESESDAINALQSTDSHLQEARMARIAQWAASWAQQFRNDSAEMNTPEKAMGDAPGIKARNQDSDRTSTPPTSLP
jgi:hypothetical protein